MAYFTNNAKDMIASVLNELHERKYDTVKDRIVFQEDNKGGIYVVKDTRRYPFYIVQNTTWPNKFTIRIHGLQRTITITS